MYASPLRTPLIRTGKYGLRAAGAGGSKASANHEGTDLRAPVGTPFFPTVPGVVVQTVTGWRSASSPGVSSGRAIFRPGMGGNQVVVRGDDGRDHNFGHAQSVVVKVGQQVGLDTRLGTTGATGVSEPHLHYGVWVEYAPNRWRSVDPTPLLPWDGDKFGELKAVASASAVAMAEGFLMALSDTEQAEILALARAIRHSQIVPGTGYTYDAAILSLVQGARAGQSGPVDVAALAAQLREGLGAEIASELARRLTD